MPDYTLTYNTSTFNQRYGMEQNGNDSFEDGDDFVASEEELQMESIYRMILIIQGTASAFLNIVVISVYFRMGSPRKKFPNYMLVCTAFSDLLVSGLTWMFYLLSANNDGSPKFDKIAMANFGLIDYSFSLCLGTLLLSALDRMLSVVNPLRHRNMMMKHNIKCVIIVVWLVALIPPLVRLGVADFNLDNLYGPRGQLYIYSYRSILIFLILVVIVILIVTCIRVSRVIRNPMNTVSTKKKGDEGNQMSVHKRNARVIKIFIGMIVAFAISFLPITIFMFLYGSKQLTSLGHIQVLSIIMSCDLLYLSSAVVNPLITLTLKEDYRRVFMRLFRRKRDSVYQSRRQETNRSNITASTNL